MSFNGLKQIAYQSVVKQEFKNIDNVKNNINKIITGTLLYKTLQRLMSSSEMYLDDIKETSDNYAKTYKSISESLEGKFVSYKQISKLISKYKLTSFMQINETQLNEIYSIYLNKNLIEKFSLEKYSPSTYGLINVSEKDNERLIKIHFKVMVPIIKYYMIYNKISLNDISIEDCGDIPGREVKFAISKVPSNQIFLDLENNLMNVGHLIYNFDIISDNFVRLIIK